MIARKWPLRYTSIASTFFLTSIYRPQESSTTQIDMARPFTTIAARLATRPVHLQPTYRSFCTTRPTHFSFTRPTLLATPQTGPNIVSQGPIRSSNAGEVVNRTSTHPGSRQANESDVEARYPDYSKGPSALDKAGQLFFFTEIIRGKFVAPSWLSKSIWREVKEADLMLSGMWIVLEQFFRKLVM